ncbi:MAG TPA: DcrB-related protein [Rhodothermales bacterium]
MAASIPEYYRHLAEKKSEAVPEAGFDAAMQEAGKLPPAPPRGHISPKSSTRMPDPPTLPYRAHRFGIHLYEGWQDKTIFFLTGPVADGVQHNVVVILDDVPKDTRLIDFADTQVRAIEESLHGLRVLSKGMISLANGLPAYRVIYRWYPKEGQRFYQEQIYVVHEAVAYKLTATFTRKTRKTLGPQVERIMLSFEPGPPQRP